MTGRTHLAVGTATGSFAGIGQAAGLPATWLAVVVAVSAFASLAPDLDHRGSRLSRAVPPLHWLYRMILSNPVTWLAFGWHEARRLAAHRSGLAHSLIGLAVGAGILWALLAWVFAVPAAALWPIALAWTVGYGSHLVLDMLTAGGVSLFVPFSNRRVGLLPRSVRRMIGWVERQV